MAPDDDDDEEEDVDDDDDVTIVDDTCFAIPTWTGNEGTRLSRCISS